MFHTWNEPAEVINMVIDELGEIKGSVYGLPGQHDLPNHRYEDLDRSAFGTLVKSHAVVSMAPEHTFGVEGAVLVGFPWGFPLTDFPDSLRIKKDDIAVAVCHRFLWNKAPFPGVTAETSVENTAADLYDAGFDVGVFGDNHQHFIYEETFGDSHVQLLNCGPIVRRRVEESTLIPCVGLLWDDGTFSHVPLNCSGDLWVTDAPAEPVAVPGVDAAELVDLLRRAHDGVVSFRETVRRAADEPDLPAGVRENLLRWVK